MPRLEIVFSPIQPCPISPCDTLSYALGAIINPVITYPFPDAFVLFYNQSVLYIPEHMSRELFSSLARR